MKMVILSTVALVGDNYRNEERRMPLLISIEKTLILFGSMDVIEEFDFFNLICVSNENDFLFFL